MKKKKKNTWVIVLIILIILSVLGTVAYFYLQKSEELTPSELFLQQGCVGIADYKVQDCCERWIKQFNIKRPTCDGEWVIIKNTCAWKCTMEV